MPEAAAYTRPFADTLREIRKGDLVTELADELAKLVSGVLEVGKPGSLTLKLTVSPTAKADGMVTVTDDLVVKEPKPDRPSSWFFATEKGELSRHHPDQAELPLRSVTDTREG